MGFKETMEEIYKFLRDKIITRLGDYLTENQKELLYSFETDKNIVINNVSNKAVLYDRETDTFNISDGFLTTEYIDKLKLKNINYDIESLKTKINESSYEILLEELIVYSNELNIKERDIIKSLFTQEIMNMVLLNDNDTLAKKVIMEGFIELIAHEIGGVNGFIVSTPYKKAEILEVVISLKEMFGKKFENIIFNKSSEQLIELIEDKKLLKKINEIIDDRKVIESTQNLDEVVDSINEIVDEVSQISIVEDKNKSLIKFIDEKEESHLFESSNNDEFLKVFNEIKKQKGDGEKVTKEELIKSLDLYNNNEPLYKLYNPNLESPEVEKMNEEKLSNDPIQVNESEGEYIKEAIIKIEDSEQPKLESFTEVAKEGNMNDEEFKEAEAKYNQDTGSLTLEELNKMNDYLDEQNSKSDVSVDLVKKSKKKILLPIIILTLTVAVGILIGWLLFKLK